MSRPLAIAVLALALAPLPLALARPAASIVATPVPIDPRDPGTRRIGRLDYLGGWALRGSDRRFGGISSMTIEHGVFTMLSDTGIVHRFRFDDGRATGYTIAPLPDGPGGSINKTDRDSESVTFDPASGRVWAGFETRNQIWRYSEGFAAAEGHVSPPAMASWPANLGAEAMVRLRDGRFLVFAETRTRRDGSHLALAFPGDPVEGAEPATFGFTGPKDFAPTDAAELPDGRVAVLMRRFSIADGLRSLTAGFAAALVVIDPRALRPDETLSSVELARFAPPLTVDNMEALAVEKRGGRTVLWIASDDNFFFAERTLLLAFALRDR